MNARPDRIAMVLSIALIIVLFGGPPACSEETRDTTQVLETHRAAKKPVDYILWPISTALKLPWWTLSEVLSQPVKLVESQSLLPTIQEWLEFAEAWGVYPVLNYKSTSGLVGGLGFFERNLFARGIGLKVKATYSTNTYRYASLRVGGENWHGGRVGLTGEIGWRANTRERLYGIGPDSKADDRSNYGRRGMFGTVTGYWRIIEKLHARSFVAVQSVKPEDGRLSTVPYQRDSIADLFAGQSLYGLFEKLDLMEYGGGVEYDWRSRPGSPLGGGLGKLRVSYVTGSGANETDVGFWKIRAEGHYYLNLFSERVLGLRILAERTDPDEGTRVPFYRLAQIGGYESLRGYTGGRFTDRDMVVFTAEYRWPLWRRLDAYVFTDQGRVFGDLIDDFELANFRSSYGFGFRLWRAAGNSSITFAQSAETFKFYFRLES